MEKHEYKLKDDYIHMIQLLKVLSLVSSGGEGKEVVREGLVTYNGEVDYRMRLKVRKGDKIEFEDNFIEVI